MKIIIQNLVYFFAKCFLSSLVFLFVFQVACLSQSSKSKKHSKVEPLVVQIPDPVSKYKWNVYDTTFKLLISTNADSFKVEGNRIIRYVNDRQQIVFPIKEDAFYDDIKGIGNNIYQVLLNEKWGLLDLKHHRSTPIEYLSIQRLPPFYLVQNENGMGLLDSTFKILLKPEYEKISVNVKLNRVVFKSKKTSGFFNLGSETKILISEVDSLTEINDSLFLSWIGKECSLLNSCMESVSLKCFLNACQVSDTALIAFDRDSLYQFHLQQKTWNSRKEQVVRFLNDTLGLIKEDTLMGVYHFRSDTIHHFEGDTAWLHPILRNKLLTKKGPFYGLASYEGSLLANYNRCFVSIGEPENGYMKVISKGKYGFIDTSGRMYFATLYDSVKPVVNGHAAIKLRGKWGYASRKESIAVQPNYSKATSFLGETAPVWIGRSALLVNNKGQELFKPRFDDMYPATNFWISKLRGLCGLLETDGKEVFNPRFSQVTETNSGFFIVTQYEKNAVLDQSLDIIFPFGDNRIKCIRGTDLFIVEVK